MLRIQKFLHVENNVYLASAAVSITIDETFLYRTEKKAIQAILLVWALVTILASPLVPAHGLYQINKEQVS
jgi:hypothetical protein